MERLVARGMIDARHIEGRVFVTFNALRAYGADPRSRGARLRALDAAEVSNESMTRLKALEKVVETEP